MSKPMITEAMVNACGRDVGPGDPEWVVGNARQILHIVEERKSRVRFIILYRLRRSVQATSLLNDELWLVEEVR